MSLDAGAYAALGRLYDASKVRPEFVIPVLASESGLDPSRANAGGYPYYGINQASGTYLEARGIDPQDYLSWPASQQIDQVVTPMMRANVGYLGRAPRSATLTYQLNFLPGSVKTAKALCSVIAWRGTAVYNANPGLDWLRLGAIRVDDLAHFMARALAGAGVKAAIKATYAARPDLGRPSLSPVYGTDFVDPLWWLGAMAAAGLNEVRRRFAR